LANFQSSENDDKTIFLIAFVKEQDFQMIHSIFPVDLFHRPFIKIIQANNDKLFVTIPGTQEMPSKLYLVNLVQLVVLLEKSAELGMKKVFFLVYRKESVTSPRHTNSIKFSNSPRLFILVEGYHNSKPLYLLPIFPTEALTSCTARDPA
jgi:hypothetical protein